MNICVAIVLYTSIVLCCAVLFIQLDAGATNHITDIYKYIYMFLAIYHFCSVLALVDVLQDSFSDTGNIALFAVK